MTGMMIPTLRRVLLAALGAAAAGVHAQGAAPVPVQPQATNVVYRCPGNLYTSELTPKQAEDKGCKLIEGAPVTIVQGGKPRSPAPIAVPGSGPRPADQKVSPADQKARDSDARRILEAELSREEERLAAMRKDYNNGEPERQGDERNYQKYLDRVADMKSAIARKENDIQAIRRELAKLPP